MANKLPIEFSSYASTRLPASVQLRRNVYSNSQRGVRAFPGMSVFFAAIALTFNSTRNISATNSAPVSIRWRDNGLAMYLIDQNTESIEQWSIAPAWSGTGGGFTVAKALSRNPGSGPTVNPILYDWKSDGTKFYIGITGGGGEWFIEEWSLSGAWSVNTASFTSATDVSSTLGATVGPGAMSSDGTKMYVARAAGFVYELAMSTAYDASTISTTPTTSLDVTAKETSISSLFFTSDGLKMYFAGETSRTIFQYNLTTAWDLSTATFVGSTTVSSDIANLTGICYGDSNDALFVVDDAGPDTVDKFDAATGGTNTVTARGADVMAGIPYLVLNTTLYSVSSALELTAISTSVAGTDVVGMSNDGTNLVITAGANKYLYTVAGGFETISTSVLGDAYTSGYLDLRFYYDQADGKFAASEQSQPETVDALDFATAESFNDDTLAVFRHNQLLYICGETTIEIWFSSQVGRPPVDRQKVIERGIVGRRAINSIDNMIYFVDDKRRPNVMTELDYRPIWTPALGSEWDSYTTVSDCIVGTFSWEQENFAEFQFPTEAVTWTYHENSQQWSRRDGTDTDGTTIINWRVRFYIEAYSNLLGVDASNGKLYQFSDTVYQLDTLAYFRTIDSDLFTVENYGVEADSMTLSQLSLTISAETGGSTVDVSLTTDPADLTPTFTAVRTITLLAGTHTYDLFRWGRLREGVFRMTTSSNDRIEFVDIAAKAEVLYD